MEKELHFLHGIAYMQDGYLLMKELEQLLLQIVEYLLGTIIGYIGTQMIIIAMGWEWAFYIFGIVGLVWFIFWFRNVTSYPNDHKKITSEELVHIQKNAPSSKAAKKIPLRQLLINKPFLAIVAATFANNWSLFVFLSFLPKFIDNELGIEL